jgi:hypothetical protein
MACCALAVFLLGQLYVAYELLAKRLGIVMPSDGARTGAADWRPGLSADRAPPALLARTLFATRGRRIAIIGTLSLTLALGAFGLSIIRAADAGPVDIRALLSDPKNLCRGSIVRE